MFKLKKKLNHQNQDQEKAIYFQWPLLLKALINDQQMATTLIAQITTALYNLHKFTRHL